MNKKLLTIGVSAVAIVCFIGLAVLYWTIPAGRLPQGIPGYESGSQTIHFKHGVGSVLLAFAVFAFAWFQTGKPSSPENKGG